MIMIDDFYLLEESYWRSIDKICRSLALSQAIDNQNRLYAPKPFANCMLTAHTRHLVTKPHYKRNVLYDALV